MNRKRAIEILQLLYDGDLELFLAGKSLENKKLLSLPELGLNNP